MLTSKDKFLLINIGGGTWALKQDGVETPVRVYAKLDERSAILKAAEDLQGKFTVIYVTRRKTKA